MTGQATVARAKFAVPRVPNATVHREALVARLDAATNCPLTLVVAAPGSGKTALLGQWVSGLDGPVAWLTCDATDTSADSFWTDLATAVGLAWTDAGTAAIDPADGSRGEELAVALANELGALGVPGVIVVDDFHCAGPEPAAMRAFIGALPPQVRVVLGGRRDPLFPVGKLRVQGRLLELRQTELRFTGAEARQLLAALGVEVSDRELEQILSITEGWTAAVSLAGLWLRAHRDPAGLVRGLVGTDRSLVDFLMNEVIELQPPEIVEFLMVTAELETFAPTLCDAVRGRHDSAELLARVDAANLFLVRLDVGDGWHRYHHLFAAFLRGRLRAVDPARAQAIHRDAAAAYEQRGDLMHAVDHSMKADDIEGALAQLESYATTTWSLEDQMAGGATARAWLREHGASHLERSPRSILACTIVLNAIGHGDDADAWLRQVEALEPALDRESRFLLHGAWSFDRLQHGHPAAALARARRAEDVMREGPVESAWATALPNMVIQGCLWLDDLDGAAAAVDAARVDALQPTVASQVRMPGFASQIQVLRGELTDAERLAVSALSAADQLGLHEANFGRAEPHLTLAMIALEQDRLDAVETHLEETMRVVEGGRRPPVELVTHLERALLAGARGDDTAAADAIQRARTVFAHPSRPVIARIDQVDLRLALDRDDPAAAEALATRLPPSPASALLAARVRLAASDPGGARDILEAVADQASTRRLQIEHSLLSALAGDGSSRSQDLLHRALALAEPVGFHRTLLAEGPALWKLLQSLPAHGRIAAYVADLLDAADHVVPPPKAATQEGLIEPLSERELTVLRYLASRLTCTEIARELYLSANTVRSHVKAIYRKLGVSSRADAVGRGRALGVS
jgi:LuxR family transcriptional regulator, maltose regulon positive regulatory protein